MLQLDEVESDGGFSLFLGWGWVVPGLRASVCIAPCPAHTKTRRHILRSLTPHVLMQDNIMWERVCLSVCLPALRPLC
jgi:hypothetical protein